MMHHPEVAEAQQATKFWTGFIRHPERSEGSQVVCRLNDNAIAGLARNDVLRFDQSRVSCCGSATRNDAREVIVPQAETDSSQLTVHYSQQCDCGSKPAMTCCVLTKAESHVVAQPPAMTEVHKRAAFTLAEVLITLAIIGVVAAVTIPTIVSKYKKHVVGVKLARFHSTMTQALLMAQAEKGVLKFEQVDLTDSEYLTSWYRDNITKYIKTIHEERPEKSKVYYKAIFIDGSGFNSYYSGIRPDGTPGLNVLYVFYCIDYKSCKYGHFDGINTFLFIINFSEARMVTFGEGMKLKYLIDTCANPGKRWSCATLIKQNNWKVPDYYPLKF